MKRWQNLLATYGPIAMVVYLSIFALVLCGFAAALAMGFEVDGVTGQLGLWGAAYVGTKIAQPLRIAATLALTPLVARMFPRLVPNRSAQPEPVVVPVDEPRR